MEYCKGDGENMQDISTEHSGLFKLKERGKIRYIKNVDLSERVAQSFAYKKSARLSVSEEA